MILSRLRFTFCKFVPPQEQVPELLNMFTLSKADNFKIIQQIAKQYNQHSHRHLFTPEKKKLLLKEFDRYKDGKGYFDKIATIGWAIKRLGFQRECKPLLGQFAQRIQNDQWYVNFDQSIRAIETFFQIAPSKKSEIYAKIQRNIQLTMWEVNQKYYEKITNALIRAGRHDSSLWQTVEYYCMRNLSMDYQPLTVINILLNFAKANQGSAMFYDNMMRVFYKGGHLFQMNPLLTLVHHSYDSSVVSTLIEAFGRASLKYRQLDILPQFRDYVFRLIESNQFHLQELLHVVTIMRYSRQLGFDKAEIQDIDMRVLLKLTEVGRVSDILQIIEFHNMIAEMGIKLPEAVIDYVALLTLEAIGNGTCQPAKYLRVFEYLKNNGLEGKIKMQGFVIDWVNQHSRSFTSSDLKFVLSWIKNNNWKIDTKGGQLSIQKPSEDKTKQLGQ